MSPKTTPIAASVSAGSDDLRERLLASKEEERGLHEGAQANPAPHKMQPHEAFFAGALAKSRLMRSPSLSDRASHLLHRRQRFVEGVDDPRIVAGAGAFHDLDGRRVHR